MKIILKGCPRCHGDLVPDYWDLDGRDMCCVQCGFLATPAVVGALVRPRASAAPRSVKVLVPERAA
jgi:hypothetical protein